MRVLNYLISNFRLVKIGTTQAQRKLFWRLNRETEAIRKEGGEATGTELANRLQVSEKAVENMQIRMAASESSLDATLDVRGINDQGSVTLLDVTDSGEQTPEHYTTSKRMHAWVQSRMVEFEQRLSEKELAIWNYRIASDTPLTLDEVGEQIGTSRQYVSQTEKRLQTAFTKYARNKARD